MFIESRFLGPDLNLARIVSAPSFEVEAKLWTSVPMN